MFNGYLPAIMAGVATTLEVAVFALLLAVTLGLLNAVLKISPFFWLRWPAQLYSTVMRGVPDLVAMLLLFYGMQIVCNALTEQYRLTQWDIDPYIAGVATLGLIYGAYFSETFRGAFIAVPGGQLEAGLAYGMSRGQVFRRVLMPQMMRFAIPGITNNWLVLLKGTAIVTMIGLQDMTWVADQAGRATHQPFVFYMLVCVLYLALTACSQCALAAMHKHYSLGVQHAEL
ncbi:ABC transporter permease subunit [Pseudomonas putida]|uniref:ABC transporter permease n=1 Tax=Pseudomonas putida TaxID=303 RepID=UPI00301DEA7E